jgi:hypothetical protein
MSGEIWFQRALPGLEKFQTPEDITRFKIENLKNKISQTATLIYSKIKPLNKKFILMEGFKTNINNKYFPSTVKFELSEKHPVLVYFFMSADIYDPHKFNLDTDGPNVMVRCVFDKSDFDETLIYQSVEVFTGEYGPEQPMDLLPGYLSEKLKALRIVQSALSIFSKFDNVAQCH